MNRMCMFAFTGSLALLVGSTLLVETASARSEYDKAWVKKYIGEKGKTRTSAQKKLEKAVKEVKKCNQCHDPRRKGGKISKKNRNPYGIALAKVLKKKEKNVKKINAALDKVGKMRPKGKKTGPTYGDMLKKGKLPYMFKRK